MARFRLFKKKDSPQPPAAGQPADVDDVTRTLNDLPSAVPAEDGQTRTIALDAIPQTPERPAEAAPEDEEYEYVTPHYTLNAILITVVFALVGAAVVYFTLHGHIYQSLWQHYLDSGYIQTTGVVAQADDIAAGKTAYVNGTLVVGTYVDLDTSNATAGPGDILAGYTAYVNGARITGTIPSFTPDQNIVPGTKDIVIPAGYYLTDDIHIVGANALVPASIRKDVEIFGVTGTYSVGS